MGNDTLLEYNDSGKITKVSRKLSGISKSEPVRGFAYSKKDKVDDIKIFGASGNVVASQKINYDIKNRPANIDDGRVKISYTYNDYNFPLSVENSLGIKTTFVYDRFNCLTSVTDHLGIRTEYTRTPAGLISQIVRKLGDEVITSMSVAYNKNGQPVSYLNQQGDVKKLERDEFGRVVKEFFPDDTTVEYSYNPAGQLSTILDQNKHEIKFAWDKFGLDSKSTPADQLTNYVYDQYGLLKNVESSSKGEIDRNIKYEYDKFDRIGKVTYADGEVETFQYDPWGRLAEATRGKKKETYKYDYNGRILEKNSGNIIKRYEYNNYGQRTKFTLIENGKQTVEEYGYDQYGRLAQIRKPTDHVLYTYDKNNRIAVQTVNGTPIHFTYNKFGQLQKKTLGEIKEVGTK